MFKQGCVRYLVLIGVLLFSLQSYASFIESTVGTAVVNDATATYHNPAALTLLKNPQIITLGSIAYFNSRFTGQIIQPATGYTQAGSSSAQTHYYLPSFYLGLPTSKNVTVGFAVISNLFNRDIESNSILRYVQSSNQIQDIDLVPAIGIKLNNLFSVGAGVTISRADFILQPISGPQGLTVPDSQSHNESSGTSWGGDAGILLTPSRSTLIGFDYHSSIIYQLNGKSILETNPSLISNNYRFKFWTPARSVFSVSQFVTPALGFIGTIQRIQWDVFKTVNIYGIATAIGGQPVIVPSATVNFHLHNSWILTLGSHYRVTPKWVVRAAATYNQSPSNGDYQISNGDSIILGASTGYDLNKYITIDGSYAHAFIQNQTIHITTGRNIIDGVNKGFRDAVSLKLTFNIF